MKGAKSSVSISAELKAFLESGVSVVVGTRDSTFVPDAVRAWGPRVGRDRRSVTLCVALATSGRTLDNLRNNGCVVPPGHLRQGDLEEAAAGFGVGSDIRPRFRANNSGCYR